MEFINSISFNDPKFIATVGVLGLTILYMGKKYFEGGVCKVIKNLQGKIVLITGANCGIGKETAGVLASFGATVILACRDEKKTLPVVDELIKTTNNKNIEFMKLDLSDLDSVKEFADKFKSKYKNLHILINNAGIMMLPKRETTKQGFESQFGVNHLGHFLLTMLLIDLLKQSAPSRVVVLSSRANYRGHINFKDMQSEKFYGPMVAYRQSKLANILFARELNRRLEGTGVVAVSVHPGAVRTELGRYIKSNLSGKLFYAMIQPIYYYMFKSSLQGAQTSIYCAIADDIKDGEYYADCRVTKADKEAYNKDVAIKLWEVSEKLANYKSNI